MYNEEEEDYILENEFIYPYYDVRYFAYKGIHSIALDLIASLDSNNEEEGW